MGAAPLWFLCPVARRNRVWTGRYENVRGDIRRVTTIPRGHEIVRTGRTKPNPSRGRGSRTLDTAHEYRCSCGHVGWSTHVDVARKPLA